MPRNIEFFYSCNRLKVAISRAHCLSVILQTRSLEIPCTTIDQMQLVNTLCWVKHMLAISHASNTSYGRRLSLMSTPSIHGRHQGLVSAEAMSKSINRRDT